MPKGVPNKSKKTVKKLRKKYELTEEGRQRISQAASERAAVRALARAGTVVKVVPVSNDSPPESYESKFRKRLDTLIDKAIHDKLRLELREAAQHIGFARICLIKNPVCPEAQKKQTYYEEYVKLLIVEAKRIDFDLESL